MTIDPDDEALVEIRGSCTKEEAVAKLLDWNRGPLRKRYIQLTSHGVPRDQWPHAYSPDEPLEEQVRALREQALRAFYAAFNGDLPQDELNQRMEDVDVIESIIQEAQRFMIDIEEELAKGEGSRLRVAQEATRETGVTHFTLASVDAWTREKYSVSILGDARPTAEAPAARPAAEGKAKAVSAHKYENQAITLTFALEALAEKAGRKFLHENNNLNVSVLADDLSKRAAAVNGNQPLPGQSAEAIKDRIEFAIKSKRSQLPLK